MRVTRVHIYKYRKNTKSVSTGSKGTKEWGCSYRVRASVGNKHVENLKGLPFWSDFLGLLFSARILEDSCFTRKGGCFPLHTSFNFTHAILNYVYKLLNRKIGYLRKFYFIFSKKKCMLGYCLYKSKFWCSSFAKGWWKIGTLMWFIIWKS